MKNVRILLLPMAVMSISLYADEDRQERVERMGRALHLGADYCEESWVQYAAIGEVEKDAEDATLPEILSAFDSKHAGKDAVSRARSKNCSPCDEFAANTEKIKMMFMAVQSLPEADGLTYKEIKQKVEMNQDFSKKMKDLMEPFER